VNRVEHSEYSPSLQGPDGQSLLFPVASPLPGVSADGGKAEKELFDAAYKYAKGWIRSHQGTAAEFISSLMDQFGFGIRLWVADLVEWLRHDADIIRLDR